MNRKKGNVLVQVLMTAVIVSVIAAGMMNLILLRAQAIKHAQAGAAGLTAAKSGLDAILEAWNNNPAGPTNCTPVSGYSMTGSPGNCNCSYTPIHGTTTFCAGTGCNPPVHTNPDCSIQIVGQVPQ
jgi:hypothetical protein